MSGICGCIALAGAEPGERDLRPMLDEMAFRGPDGMRLWANGGAALGYALLATTPEAASEAMPLIDEASGLVLVGDIRLDNRADLAAALALDPRGLGDGAIVLAAYRRWGEDCCTRLHGDFAFAIWNSRHRRLFAARDPAGMRPLCFAVPRPGLLLFASDALAIGAHSAVEQRLNEERIADLFAEMEALDMEATLLAGVSRLKAGYRLRFDERGLRSDRYHCPVRPPPLRLKSGADYAAAFRDILHACIDSRLRACGPVASTLSGGIDSASVSAIAAQILAARGEGPLRTISVIGPDPESAGESERIQLSAASIAGLDPLLVDYFVLPPGGALCKLLDPFDAGMNLPRMVYGAAARAGHRVVLDGVGADVILGRGATLRNLLARGRIPSAVREARGEAAFWRDGEGAWRRLAAAATQAWAPSGLRRWRRRRMWQRQDEGSDWHWPFTPEFARRIGLADRRRAFRALYNRHEARGRVGPADDPIDPFLIVARERYERASALFGVEARDPFLDRRMIDFCAALPDRLLQRDGWPKHLLRVAMDGIVPDQVRFAPDKAHLGLAASEHVLGDWPVGADFPGALAGIVDASSLSAADHGRLKLRRFKVAAHMLGCCPAHSRLLQVND